MLLTFSMSVLAMLVSDPTPMKLHQKAKSTHFVSRLWWAYLVSPLDFELHSVNSTSNTRELKVTVEIIGLNHACGKRTCLLTTIVSDLQRCKLFRDFQRKKDTELYKGNLRYFRKKKEKKGVILDWTRGLSTRRVFFYSCFVPAWSLKNKKLFRIGLA